MSAMHWYFADLLREPVKWMTQRQADGVASAVVGHQRYDCLRTAIRHELLRRRRAEAMRKIRGTR